MNSPLEPPGGTSPADTWISDCWPPELLENKFLLWGFVTAALGTECKSRRILITKTDLKLFVWQGRRGVPVLEKGSLGLEI